MVVPLKEVIRCPSCGGKLRVPMDRGLLRVTCAHCSATFVHPAASTQPQENARSSNGRLSPVAPAPPTIAEPQKGDWSTPEYVGGWITGVAVAIWLLELGFLGLLGGYLVGFATGAATHTLVYPWRRRLYEKQKCEHGVLGGVVLQRCAICRAAADAAAERAAGERAEAERRTLLLTRANALRDQERNRLRSSLGTDVEALLRLTPFQFEDRIAELFRALGYSVTQTPYTGDRGRDAIARKGGNLYLIECKLYRPDRVVGRRDLQVFFAAVTEARAKRGFLVTTGRLTSPASEWIKDKPLELIDGRRLAEMMQEAYPHGHDDAYNVLCTSCGANHRYSLRSREVTRLCPCGNRVPATLTPADLLPERQQPKPPRRGTRRYRRRY
jgi:hypothetical protein